MAREEMKKYFDEVMVQKEYIDVLINGATLCDESNIDATINSNLTGMMNTGATVLPYMDRKIGRSGGLIVNVTSVIEFDPSPVFCAYSASKFGVIGFTRSWATKLQRFFDGQSFADRFRHAPFQSTSACGQNIVNAIQRGEHGQIWIANKGGLELVKLHWYWQMVDQFLNYMQCNDDDDQD